MVKLSDRETLVLFEFCHRICETSKVAASHPAEIALIDKIAGQLERSLTEPLEPDYSARLEAARDEVCDAHRAQMGEASWINDVPLTQT